MLGNLLTILNLRHSKVAIGILNYRNSKSELVLFLRLELRQKWSWGYTIFVLVDWLLSTMIWSVHISVLAILIYKLFSIYYHSLYGYYWCHMKVKHIDTISNVGKCKGVKLRSGDRKVKWKWVGLLFYLNVEPRIKR